VPGGHVQLRFDDPGAYERAAGGLRETVRDDRALTLQIPSDGTPRALREILDWLDAADVHADALTVHTPDLDDVFFALTGRVAVPDQPKEAVR
jgi:ABC-2 type transport system ATP-binding protein